MARTVRKKVDMTMGDEQRKRDEHIEGLLWNKLPYNGQERSNLAMRWFVPPFSVINTRDGWWKWRKKAWKEIIGRDDRAGRQDFLEESRTRVASIEAVPGYYTARDAGASKEELEEMFGKEYKTVSVFDPALVELFLRWFCPFQGAVLDPFAGGIARGLVSSYLGHPYTGMDINRPQIQENVSWWASSDRADALGPAPTWIIGDSAWLRSKLEVEYDFLFTCPPYFDTEKYTEDKDDIANMGTDDYVDRYQYIIDSACSRLRDNSFAVVVIGNQRNYNKKEAGSKNGELRSLYSITVEAFQNAGMVFYNDVIILNEVGSYSLIGSTIFKGGRKLGRVHQYALVFVKGNWREAHLRSGAACLYDRDPLEDTLVEDDGQASLFE